VAKIAEHIWKWQGDIKMLVGGKIRDYRDSFIYSEIREFIQTI